jgi:hypothetical protein
LATLPQHIGTQDGEVRTGEVLDCRLRIFKTAAVRG